MEDMEKSHESFLQGAQQELRKEMASLQKKIFMDTVGSLESCVQILGPHPSKVAFVGELHHSGETAAVQIRNVLKIPSFPRIWRMALMFPSWPTTSCVSLCSWTQTQQWCRRAAKKFEIWLKETSKMFLDENEDYGSNKCSIYQDIASLQKCCDIFGDVPTEEQLSADRLDWDSL